MRRTHPSRRRRKTWWCHGPCQDQARILRHRPHRRNPCRKARPSMAIRRRANPYLSSTVFTAVRNCRHWRRWRVSAYPVRHAVGILLFQTPYEGDHAKAILSSACTSISRKYPNVRRGEVSLNGLLSNFSQVIRQAMRRRASFSWNINPSV